MTRAGTGGADCIALVTRPGEAGQRLSSALRGCGQRALWWPAFDLLAPAELEPLRSVLQRLGGFDLAVFVSAAAVRGLAGLDLCGEWPSATAVAAVGASTLALARGALPGVAAARVAGLDADSKLAGSEALWDALQRERPLPRRVLIVRAETGREWLGDRLREAGCSVEYASVYRRVVHIPSREQRAALDACRAAGEFAASVVTSSEAVAALDRQLAESQEARAWLRQGLALCTHPRIGQALRAAGYGRVQQCEATPAGVLDAIGSARLAGRGAAPMAGVR